jgi:hypothetical protein
MKKTLQIIEQTYQLLEQDALSADTAAPQPDPTMPAEAPSAEGQPEVAPLTSEGEVSLIKKLVTLIKSVVATTPDDNTRTKIANFNVDSVTPKNARDMLAKFENMLITNKSDFETSQIDNQYGL